MARLVSKESTTPAVSASSEPQAETLTAIKRDDSSIQHSEDSTARESSSNSIKQYEQQKATRKHTSNASHEIMHLTHDDNAESYASNDPTIQSRRSTRNATRISKSPAKSDQPDRLRNISGETLVDVGVEPEPEKDILEMGVKALDMDWSMEKVSEDKKDDLPYSDKRRRKSTRLGEIAKATATAVVSAASSLGKRGIEVLTHGKDNSETSRETAEESTEPPLKKSRLSIASTIARLSATGKSALSSSKDKLQASSSSTRTSLRPRSFASSKDLTTPVSILGKRTRGDSKAQDETAKFSSNATKNSLTKADSDKDEPQLKRARQAVASESEKLTAPASQLTRQSFHKNKRWLASGLYVGQEQDFDARLTESKNKLKRASKSTQARQEKNVLPLPMFAAQSMLDSGRGFRLPFDVFAPLPPGQPKPDEWKKTQSNRFVGESASEWKKAPKLPASRCLCTAEEGCDDLCQNKYMFYECDETNCNLGMENCGNRAFADLKERSKSGRKYDIGVEVMKTAEKGFGVRACRTFEPEQIIVEYAGEIITQDECERRMRNEYKNNECYYLMTFHQNMIIDATRGSIARFINHSCEPNCRMIKWTVAGKPRMALFAGDKGIMSGEELTYDYNFDPFSQKNVQVCHCGKPGCRGFLGPRKVQEKESQKISTGVLAGAKRKLQDMLAPAKSQGKAQTASKEAKRRASANALTLTVHKQQINRRASSASILKRALAGKENAPAGGLRKSTSCSSSASSSRVKHATTRVISRRNTIQVLSKRATPSKTDVSKSANSTRRNALKAKRNSDGALLGEKSSPQVDAAKAVGTARDGVVQSIRGSRRAVAAAKMGVKGNEKRKSVKVVSKSP